MRLQPQTGFGRSRKGHDVLAGQVLEQVAHAAADELEGTFGQDPRFEHEADDPLGHVGRNRSRLDDGGHAGQERGSQFFQHAPAGEVEGVDVDGHAFERHEQMVAEKGPAARDAFGFTLEQKAFVGQFSAALAGIDEERPDAAVDVEPGVLLRGAVARESSYSSALCSLR